MFACVIFFLLYVICFEILFSAWTHPSKKKKKQWKLSIMRSLDHQNYLVIAGILLYQNKKKHTIEYKELGPEYYLVISYLFILSFHCTKDCTWFVVSWHSFYNVHIHVIFANPNAYAFLCLLLFCLI